VPGRAKRIIEKGKHIIALFSLWQTANNFRQSQWQKVDWILFRGNKHLTNAGVNKVFNK
jgi:hypothetical protein